MNDLYFEDYAVGDTFRSAGYTFTESAIIEFALKFDPQPFHIDRDAAERSHFGGLIASGWQVAIISFRLLVDAGLFRSGSMGSPGLDDAKWLMPVRPGDTIRAEATVLDKRLSSTRQDRGYIRIEFRAYNQRDELVMTYKCPEIIARRPETSAD
jgi:acyl dehydratase